MTSWKDADKAFERQLAFNRIELANIWPKHWRDFVSQTTSLIESYPDIDRIVDIGCGAGIYSEVCRLEFSHLDYLGIDHSEAAISLAKETWPLGFAQFECLDLADLSEHDFEATDVLVANALCDVSPYGDACIKFLLDLNVNYLIIQRVKVTNEDSFYNKYKAYEEVDTVEYYHNRDKLLKMIEENYHYTISYFDDNILDLLLIRQ